MSILYQTFRVVSWVKLVTYIGLNFKLLFEIIRIFGCFSFDLNNFRLAYKILVTKGTVFNLTGTALYESVAAIFISQLIGKELQNGELIIARYDSTGFY